MPRVRVVAFGSLDGDGRSNPRPLAGVTIVAIPGRSWWAWWSALVGRDLREDPLPGNLDRQIGLPVGGQFRSDAQQILRTPGAVVSTTGAAGTADIWLNPGGDYHVCVLSPDVEGLIAGCEYDFRPYTYRTDSSYGLNPSASGEAAMAYFSHGRAYLGVVRDTQRGHFWFQQIAQSVFGPDLIAPAVNPATQPGPQPGTATVDFLSDQDLRWGQWMALIEDSQVGAWWDTVSAATIAENGGPLDTAVESSPAILVPLRPDPAVYEDFLATVTVDAGVYLVCWLRKFVPGGGVQVYVINVCVYEEFPAGSHSYLNPGYLEIYPYLYNVQGYDPEQ